MFDNRMVNNRVVDNSLVGKEVPMMEQTFMTTPYPCEINEKSSDSLRSMGQTHPVESKTEMEALLVHIDDIWKLAFSKCRNSQDADDLVQETYLAALTAIHNGKTIDYPKTWLARTLMNLWNGHLRKKYRFPTVVSMDFSLMEADIPEEEPGEEEQINLKRCVASLTSLYRQVIVMYYIGGLSVSEIAEKLDVPEGTVKRRLHTGREKMKKEKLTTKEAESFTPMKVRLSWNGSIPEMSLFHFAENRIVQEILACAYMAPVTLDELAARIGIPVYYLEDLAEEAVDRELMILENGRYTTDAYLDFPEDIEKREAAAENFAKGHRDFFESLLASVEQAVDRQITGEMSERVRTKMKRFFFIETLQLTVFTVQKRIQPRQGGQPLEIPLRKSGFRWRLLGEASPLGISSRKRYGLGGHRTTGRDGYTLHEFDIGLLDSPCRFKNMEWLKYVSSLLYGVYTHTDPISLGVPPEMIEEMEWFRKGGLLTEENKVDIPVLSQAEFDACEKLCLAEAEKAADALEEELAEWMQSCVKNVPKHIPTATAQQAYFSALSGFEAAVSYDLYSAGVHLKGVDFCCPPVVLVVR